MSSASRPPRDSDKEGCGMPDRERIENHSVYRSLKFYEEDGAIFREFLSNDPKNECARLIVTAFDTYFDGLEKPEIHDGDDRFMRAELKHIHAKVLAMRTEDMRKIEARRENGQKGGRPKRGDETEESP